MGRPVNTSPAAPGARGKGALGVLLLLLLLLPRRGALALKAGETCRRWREGHPVPEETFLCPQKSDGADAQLCCGTCVSPYCCSSLGAWLDQRFCFQPGHSRQVEGVAAPQGTAVAAPSRNGEYFMLSLIVSLTLLLFFACFILVNYDAFQQYVGLCTEQQDAPPVMAAALHPISSVEEPSTPGPLDLPVPYTSCEMLLTPSSEEDSHRD